MTPPPTAAPPAPAARPAAAPAHSERSMFQGIAWTGGAKWASQIATWASTVLVARALSPGDYGLVGMATVFLGLVAMLGEFGLGAAVVNDRALGARQVRQLNTLSVALGVVCLGAGVAASGRLAGFFAAPALAPVVVALSVGFAVSGFRTVPLALMQRDLRFRRLALVDAGQALLVAGATVAMALGGLGYWSLVFSNLLGTAISTAVVLAQRPCGFAWPRRVEVGAALTFSWRILVSRLAWYTYSNADSLVVGRVLGQAVLGSYGLAWTLANLPIDKVSAMVIRVTPAYFAAVAGDRATLRRYFLTLTEALAMATVPATVGLALVADDFVRVVLGERWEAAAVPLRLLALYAAFRSVVPLVPQVLNAVGDARFAMWMGVASALVLPPAFYVGTRWGAAGVAWTWVVAYPLLTAPLYARLFRALGMPARDYARALWPAATGSVGMALAVASAQHLLAAHPAPARLAAAVAAGGAAYLVMMATVHRPRVRAMRDVLRPA
jgi:PST family polysaccharide transporter